MTLGLKTPLEKFEERNQQNLKEKEDMNEIKKARRFALGLLITLVISGFIAHRYGDKASPAQFHMRNYHHKY